MMALGFIGTSSAPRLVIALIIGFGALAAIWLGFARGTYVLIDRDNNMYRTSGFFLSKTVPLSDIVELSTSATFAGLMTEIKLTYRDKDGHLRIINTMNVQSFKTREFKNYLNTLHLVNPNIAIPRELFAK
jgi:hypothetical protein